MANNSDVIATVQKEGSTSQTIFVADVISEGPIEGLVRGESSVYLNGVSLVEAQDSTYIPPVTTTVTFSGTSTGTYSSDLDNVYDSQGSIRYLFLEGVQQVTGVSVSHANGTNTFTMTKAATDFSTYKTFGVAADYRRIAKLTRLNTTIIGEVNSSGVFISKNPITTSATLNASDYTLTIIEGFSITSASLGSVTVDVSTPPSGTYSFWIGPIDATPEYSSNFNSSNTQKINNTSVQFRHGHMVQDPLEEVGGVGDTPSYPGDYTPTDLVQVGNPADLELPELAGHDNYGYPSGQTADGTPRIIPAGNTGFDLTAAQILEVDELRIPISYNAMIATSENTGNTKPATAMYDISIQTELNGEWTGWKSLFPKYVEHTAEISSPISFEHSIYLESFRPFTDFNIRVTRLTRHVGVSVIGGGGDSKKRYKADTSAVLGTPVSIFKEKFIYPYTAYAGITFSSEDYSSIPQRTYECRGLKVKVPTTYTTREALGDPLASPDDMYSGLWSGNFKEEKEYTDNPAWIFYDIIENNRYGAGEWITPDFINKFALYRIARYCDELVDDGTGKGTKEPRFRANVYLTKAADVYKVLKDMATIFTGMLYFLEGQVTAVQDAPSDPVYNFSKANVINGVFNYESTGAKTRVNQVVVTWYNPANDYTAEALLVEDRNAILEAGKIVSQEALAFGVTSEGQAARYGYWKLYTAQHQTEIINFSTSLAAGFLQPGDVISVQDADRYGNSLSGRLKGSNALRSVNLDRTITLRAGYTYELSVLLVAPAAFLAQDNATIGGVPYVKGDRVAGVTTESAASNLYDDPSEGSNLVAITWKPYTYTETRPVDTLAGDTAVLSVSSDFSAIPDKDTIWVMKEYDSTGLTVVDSAHTYKILGISETAKNEYQISAVEHHEIKYDAIEKDYALAELPDDVFPPEDTTNAVPPPKNLYVLTVSDFRKPDEELKIQWDHPDYDHIGGYEIYHTVRGEEKIIRVKAGRTTHRFNKVVDGQYLFKVRTVSTKGRKSKWITASILVDDVFGENVPRLGGGMVRGAVSSTTGFITADNKYRLASENYALAPLQTALDPYVNTSSTEATYMQDISGISAHPIDGTDLFTRMLTSFYIYFDRNNADKLKLVRWDFWTFKNLYYWFDAGTGAQSPSFYDLSGTASIAVGSNKVIGTDCFFLSELDIGDVIQVAPGVGAKVAAIIDDNFLLLDRSFSDGYTDQEIATTTLQVDFETDCVFARVYYEGGGYYFDNFLTIDPDLESLAKFINTDSNVQFINYAADESQESTYANITLDVTALGFTEPEFMITGSAFSDLTGSADATWQTGTDNVYVKQVHNSSDVAYASGSALDFTIDVREGNDPNNANKQKSSTFSILKVIGGSVGVDAKAVKLTAEDYSIIYDAKGENPEHNGTPGTIVLTASAQGFLNPNYKFTVDGVTDPSYGASATKNFSVPINYYDTSKIMSVSVSEQGADTEEAFDNISIHGVKPGTDGYTVILSNDNHSIPTSADGSGGNFSGSGGFFEVFKGATQLTFVAGTPVEGEYAVTPGTNTDLTPSTPTLTGQGTAFATIPDFSGMVDDTEVILYTVNAENISTNIIKQQSFSKAKQGLDGATGLDGRTVRVTTTKLTFRYDEGGNLETVGQSTQSTSTATVSGATGNLYYEWFVNNVSEGPPTLNDNTHVYNAQTDYADMPDELRVEVREGTATDPIVASDERTFSAQKAGSDAVTFSQTNQAVALPASATGVVSSYNSSGTYIRVWWGTKQLDYGISGDWTFDVVAVGTYIVPDSTPTTQGVSGSQSRVYSAHSGMDNNEDEAWIDYTITARNNAGDIRTTNALQTFSKSKTGVAGTDGTDGAPGTDGTDGAPGADGADGDNVANGILYYQTLTASDPGAPPAGTWDFLTGTYSGAAGWGPTPPTITPGTSDTAWHISWTATGANGSRYASMNYSGRVEGIVMSGLVTFITGDFVQDGSTITTIDGGNIASNTITANTLTVGAVNNNGVQIQENAIIIKDGGTIRVKLGNLSAT